jgi:uncharacterized membrane protein YidH (DUF202 family)
MTRKHRNPPVDLNTELAFQRTRQAADRTLMAWMRSSISMISFGFSIGKLCLMPAALRFRICVALRLPWAHS